MPCPNKLFVPAQVPVEAVPSGAVPGGAVTSVIVEYQCHRKRRHKGKHAHVGAILLKGRGVKNYYFQWYDATEITLSPTMTEQQILGLDVPHGLEVEVEAESAAEVAEARQAGRMADHAREEFRVY